MTNTLRGRHVESPARVTGGGGAVGIAAAAEDIAGALVQPVDRISTGA